MKQRNEILELSFKSALMIVEFSEVLEEKRKYVIAGQLLRPGTSIGDNVREVQSTEIRADFVHKLKISHKEAEETEHWWLQGERAEAYLSRSQEVKLLLSSTQKLLGKTMSTSTINPLMP